MFTAYPTYSRYRTLALTDPRMKGEDVYALQTALNEAGYPCGTADGILGNLTAGAIREAQLRLGLTVDGLAGGQTQRALALRIADRYAQKFGVLLTAIKGQIEHESGFRLGNYSPIRLDGTYDAGICQRNSKFTDPRFGFDTANSIEELCQVVHDHYALFVGVTGYRRLALAQGAWNAPAFACYIAKEEGASRVERSMTLRPSSEQRTTFEAYISHVSLYYNS